MTRVGRPSDSCAPSQISAVGVARTFQNVQLFGELALIETALVRLHHTCGRSLAEVAVATSRSQQEDAAAKVRAASRQR